MRLFPPSLLRALLVWLMVLAVPVQGVAAVGMWHCAPMRAQAMEMAAMAAMDAGATQAPAGATQSHGAPHVHTPFPASAHVHGADAPVAEPSGAPMPAADADDELPDHRCSACAACCVVLGFPARAVQVPAAPPGSNVIPALAPDADSFVPGGLDRPPRRLSA